MPDRGRSERIGVEDDQKAHRVAAARVDGAELGAEWLLRRGRRQRYARQPAERALQPDERDAAIDDPGDSTSTVVGYRTPGANPREAWT